MTEEIASPAQDDWKELAAAIRCHLLKLCECLPAMTVEEQHEFVQMCQAAYWLEHNAAIFDRAIEKEMRDSF